MKKFSKILSVALLVALVLSFGAMAFADEGTGENQAPAAQAEPTEFTGGDFSETPEDTISVTGLTDGDSASYFKLVEWDATESNWKLTSLGENCGVSLTELLNGITEAEATTIATNVTGDGTAMDVDGTTATATVQPGLYYVKAIPAENNKTTVYNPAFVSADYYEGGNTVDLSSAIGSSAVLKKSDVPFDKEVNKDTTVNLTADSFVDVKPGDIIPYDITTTIPSYGTTFTNPVFRISDTLSAGLTLKTPITVKYGETEVTATNDDVVITTTTSGFTVAFTEAYLTGLAGATPAVKITYSAEVTLTGELENVTFMDNKAKLTYSNSPSTTKDQDDITRHYTFSIDANLNGGNHGNERTRELIKIGVDDNGQVITDFTSWVDGEEWTTYTPLEGAVFTLVGTGANTGVTKTATSTAEGYISFYGLDAGTYDLTETSAPTGYVKDSTTHHIVIAPVYTEGTDILESYTITVDDNTMSSYTITNMNDTAATVETTVDNSSKTFPFINTKGVELPSTGGIGTTIFYVVGGVLVLAAIILLVTKKRMSE